ncbi:cytochrome P450 [Thermomonospora cellulosilytica]|uniref:Cytochrome P450 n=1 Tax=Thermomonospora cellulosilytica TaxID=1411118 RepID=A0A7W3N5C1_9ACTN|nr:cytochrome P450 [Thermomonospora cellulosilytica]MBA9007797.1 cytochrome P450 [Thermomonospora cellulosilytica]
MDHLPSSDALPGIRGLTSVSSKPLLTRDFDVHPTATYEGLRAAHGPVAPVDLLGVPCWLVLGYAEVLEVLRNDARVWSKRLADWRAYTQGTVPADWPPLPAFRAGGVAFTEGREHSELRAAWSAALRPFQDRSQDPARRLEAELRRHADELIALLGERGTTGRADLADEYARPLMLMAINRLAGFGEADEDVLLDIRRLLDGGPQAAEASGRLMDLCGRTCAARRSAPGEDFPSYLIAAWPDCTDEQAAAMTHLLGKLGDLTVTLVCATVVEVLSEEAAGALAGGMVRETVNRAAMVHPPYANLTFRFALADTVLGGTVIAAGDPVMLSVAAAHADPSFAGAHDPASVFSSRAHLAWGAGAHQCPGGALATTLATIAVERLQERMAWLEPALPPDRLPWRSSVFVRGLRSLPVRYGLREPSPAPPSRPSAEPSEVVEPASQGTLRRLVRVLRRTGR